MRKLIRKMFSDSLRTRVLLLVFFAMVPVTILTVHSGWIERQEAIRATEDSLQRLTNLAAANEARLIEGARQLLTALASVPGVQAGGDSCNHFLQSMLHRSKGYTNFGLIDRNGYILCSAVAHHIPIRLKGRQDLHRSILERKFVVGSYQPGDAFQKPTVHFLMPIIDGTDDEAKTVVFAALDLDSFEDLIGDIDLPPNGELVTTDAKGTIVSRRPGRAGEIGTRVPKTLYDGMVKVGFGTSAWTTEDGIDRLNAFASVGTLDESSFRVTIGIPSADIVAAAGDALVNKLLGLLGVTVAALLAAWFVADIVVLRRVKMLVKTADAIAAGQLTISTGVPPGNDEISYLARRFDTMIRSLRRYDLESRLDKATLYSEKERAEVTLASIGDAVISTDRFGKVEYMNRVAEKLTGWRMQDAKGLPSTLVFQIVDETTRVPSGNPLEQSLTHRKVVTPSEKVLLISRSGGEYAVEDTAAPIFDYERHLIGAVLVFRDVTESRKLTAQLSYQATHDALTGLLNRREFERRLQLIMDSGNGPGHEQREHALLYLDLDRFKFVNDTAGHAAGDVLLRQLTARLQSQLRESDTLARLGGDEFAVILENCHSRSAFDIAEKLRRTVADFRLDWDGKTFTVGTSIGITMFGGSQSIPADLATLMNAADCACYVAKASGRNRVHLSQPDGGAAMSA